MKSVFADTSGYFAALYSGDPHHAEARACFLRAEDEGWAVYTTNYVVVESTALVQARLGWEMVREFHEVYGRLSRPQFVDPALHAAAAARHKEAVRRHLSLVDCVSLEWMERHGVRQAIAFDRHFTELGITLP